MAVTLLVKKQQNVCAVMVIFPDSDQEQILAVNNGRGMMPLVFEEGSEDHLPMIRMAQEAKDQLPDVQFEVVKFTNREHVSFIEKEQNAGKE